MSDAPDELESAMILGDPGETVSLDTIKAMARAVRDAGYERQPTPEACREIITIGGWTGELGHEFGTYCARCGVGIHEEEAWTTPIVKGEA